MGRITDGRDNFVYNDVNETIYSLNEMHAIDNEIINVEARLNSLKKKQSEKGSL